MAREEVENLQSEFSALRQEVSTEVVNTSNQTGMSVRGSLEEAIDEKVDKFFLIFKEKDKILEDKNQVIFMLQKRVVELETKIQHMVALPDYNKEKQEVLLEKEKMENKLRDLKGSLKNEKLKQYIYNDLKIIFE